MDDIVQRGTKRKRYDPPPQDLGVKIKGKLHHDLKEVKKAAKKAKLFESQKLIKRLKDLRRNSEKNNESAEAEGQLEALKGLDHERIATTALKTKLKKFRILYENEHVQAAMSLELAVDVSPATPGTPTAKIQARLLSSKILAMEVTAAVEDLKNVIQPKADSVNPIAEEEAITERPKNVKNVAQTEVKGQASSSPSKSAKGSEVVMLEEDGVRELDDAGWESGTVSDEERQVDDDWEAGSVLNEEDVTSAEEPDSDEEVGVAFPTAKLPKKALPSKSTTLKSLPKPSGLQSTFLPSLAVGFTRGDSDDSEFSESEAKVADIDIKKNRRGQRARRAIWEKKYGRNANHKKKELEQSKAHPARGVEARRNTNTTVFNKNAPRSQAQKATSQYRQEADTGWGQRTGGTQAEKPAPATRSFALAAAKKHGDQKPIHPSWEAKRKLKEKESASIVPSQGKKIKFS